MPEDKNDDLKDLLRRTPDPSLIHPPVRPRVQVLSFNDLSWENLE